MRRRERGSLLRQHQSLRRLPMRPGRNKSIRLSQTKLLERLRLRKVICEGQISSWSISSSWCGLVQGCKAVVIEFVFGLGFGDVLGIVFVLETEKVSDLG